jgi:putative transposase
VSRDSRGRWQVAFTCQITRAAGRPAHVGPAGKVVGVDVGVASLAVLSHAVPGLTDAHGKVANPRRLAGAGGRLRRAARQVGPYDPASRSRRAPSARWGRTWRRVARLHGQVRDARADGWHQLTIALAQRFDTLVVEDLNLAGMLTRPAPKPDGKGGQARNGRAAKRGLARSIAEAAPAQLRRQLAYKTTWYGSALHVAGRFYPSSKTCSQCQTVQPHPGDDPRTPEGPKLSLAERMFTCGACGLTLDRDVNAARNLARLVAGNGTGSAPETGAGNGSNARGDPVSPAPRARLPGGAGSRVNYGPW